MRNPCLHDLGGPRPQPSLASDLLRPCFAGDTRARGRQDLEKKFEPRRRVVRQRLRVGVEAGFEPLSRLVRPSVAKCHVSLVDGLCKRRDHQRGPIALRRQARPGKASWRSTAAFSRASPRSASA